MLLTTLSMSTICWGSRLMAMWSLVWVAMYPEFPQVWDRVRQAALDEIEANPDAYYAFHAEASGYSVPIAEASYPLALFPETSVIPQGLALLEGTKQFLVSQNLAQSDFDLSDWLLPEK